MLGLIVMVTILQSIGEIMTYKDRAFCASKTKNHTCGKELSKEDIEYLKNNHEERVLMCKFCPDQKEINYVLH